MESWPFTFPQEHLSRDEWGLLIAVLRHIRAEHRALFRRFLYQRTITDVIVEYVASLKLAPTMKQIVR
jgi:hypothetical protein